MKLLVFSDIHGSCRVAEQIVLLAREHKADQILLLGDFLYHGPRNIMPEGYDPKGTAGILGPLAPDILAVKGNCDSEVDASILPFPLADSAWITNGQLRIFASHGHVFNQHKLPPLKENDILLLGHTHVPMARRHNSGIKLCNPGSLALPKEGHPPCYGLFDNGVFSVLTSTAELYMQLDCN
ncbi:phosphodiesterase [Desulfovibrio sp. OttesenSCG-928-A18]|nr:phosphodiesterase [Desulfovibrio sp. OttesenSCG-928-A18]